MGNKQSDRFFNYYSPWGDFNLRDSIKKAGFSIEEITDVFLTHLHFDHVGGATYRNGEFIETTFPKASYWTNKKHWQWATEPNAFVKPHENYSIAKELPFKICYADGHTEKQMLPIVKYQEKTIVFMGDLLPTVGHIPLPYIMSYDTRPLISLQEKSVFLEKAATNGWYLFLEHDAHHQIITVEHTEKGVRLKNTYSFNELFN